MSAEDEAALVAAEAKSKEKDAEIARLAAQVIELEKKVWTPEQSARLQALSA
jgi:hypothetical protein